MKKNTKNILFLFFALPLISASQQAFAEEYSPYYQHRSEKPSVEINLDALDQFEEQQIEQEEQPYIPGSDRETLRIKNHSLSEHLKEEEEENPFLKKETRTPSKKVILKPSGTETKGNDNYKPYKYTPPKYSPPSYTPPYRSPYSSNYKPSGTYSKRSYTPRYSSTLPSSSYRPSAPSYAPSYSRPYTSPYRPSYTSPSYRTPYTPKAYTGPSYSPTYKPYNAEYKKPAVSTKTEIPNNPQVPEKEHDYTRLTDPINIAPVESKPVAAPPLPVKTAAPNLPVAKQEVVKTPVARPTLPVETKQPVPIATTIATPPVTATGAEKPLTPELPVKNIALPAAKMNSNGKPMAPPLPVKIEAPAKPAVKAAEKEIAKAPPAPPPLPKKITTPAASTKPVSTHVPPNIYGQRKSAKIQSPMLAEDKPVAPALPPIKPAEMKTSNNEALDINAISKPAVKNSSITEPVTSINALSKNEEPQDISVTETIPDETVISITDTMKPEKNPEIETPEIKSINAEEALPAAKEITAKAVENISAVADSIGAPAVVVEPVKIETIAEINLPEKSAKSEEIATIGIPAPIASTEDIPNISATSAIKELTFDKDSEKTNSLPDMLSIFFKKDSSEISKSSEDELNKLVAALKNNPSWRVQIQAFAEGTKSTQSDARRMSLSRGLMVRSYISEHGIKPVRLDIRALGSKSEKTPLDRVDIIFMNQ